MAIRTVCFAIYPGYQNLDVSGEAFAKTVQLGLEYYPSPPFSERSPAEAPAAAFETLERFQASGGQDQLRVQAPFSGTFPVLTASV